MAPAPPSNCLILGILNFYEQYDISLCLVVCSLTWMS